MRVFTALLFALLPSCSPATSAEPSDSPATGGLGGSGGLAGTPSSNAGSSTAGSGGAAQAGGGAAQGGSDQAGSPAGGAGAGTSGSGGAAGAATAGAGGSAGAAGAAAEGWVGTWVTAQQLTEDANEPPSPGLANSTLRQSVRVSIGGQRLRLRFSNEYGSSPVILTDAYVATPTSGSAITEGSSKQLMFSGTASVTIPAKAAIWSDALDFQLSPLAKLAVSIHFGEASSDITGHPGSRTTSYLQTGSAATLATLASPSSTDHWYILSGIDVMAPSSARSLVILGDSITDGRGSTTNGNDRWPDVLSGRLQARASGAPVAVLNQGIGGNTILKGGLGPTASSRFEGDVLKQSGARWLIVFEGVNDIGADASASDLTAAYAKFVTSARGAGLRAYGATILPFKGNGYYSENHEKTRQAVNAWIREAGHFDAVIDFDAAVRDPAQTDTLLGAYDSGDHLHLNPAGYQKLAEAVDLKLFE